MAAADVVEVLGSVTILAWLTVEVMVVWAQRPPVVYDPWTGHWRAQRGMEKTGSPRLRPPVLPNGYKDPRDHLKVVRDLAS